MSGDEIIALIACVFIGFWGWKQWLAGLLFLNPLSRKPAAQSLAWLMPAVAAAAMFYVLLNFASSDVRDNPIYIVFYMVMWLGWTGLWNRLLPYLGLSCRDDALERSNAAAGLAIGGGLLGVTLAFAGANIGNGPGWYVVVFCALLATGAPLVMWLIDDYVTDVIDAITIDRDAAAGWRTAGFFIASGLILGRAVAGDWHSANETVADFILRGWPVLVLWGLLLCLDLVGRPTPDRPAPNRVIFGVVPFLVLVGAAVVEVGMQGRWT
jgi:uncharacterized membrane protein YjfL (UPF0719 family)